MSLVSHPLSKGLSGFAVLISTGFGAGFSPKAPGTVGSIPGLILGAALSMWVPSLLLRGFLLTAYCILCLWSIKKTEALWHSHDDQRIVCDEIAGQALAVAFVPISWPLLLCGFVLFRALDIWKPGPIGWIDAQVAGASGTFFDDVLAGAVAAGLLGLGLYFGVFSSVAML